jgi:cell fate (sporulation/competence/biofilm development) regulator YlbF (YheA/YmcA/DUF963 family)
MEQSMIVIPAPLQAAAERLAEMLCREDPIAEYRQAVDALETDPHARQLLDQLAAAQADMRVHQKDNSVTQADLDHLRDLQQQVETNQIIMRYAQAQQLANIYLIGVNQEISQLIGVDFAALARSGCC